MIGVLVGVALILFRKRVVTNIIKSSGWLFRERTSELELRSYEWACAVAGVGMAGLGLMDVLARYSR